MDCTVLIVDDHPAFRGLARALLESEDFRVVGEAADGEGALADVARLDPDVVLLDVELPGIDGFAVAERLSRGERDPQVVLTSSRDESDFGPLVGASQARGFVPKAELSGQRLRALLSPPCGDPEAAGEP